MRAPRVRGIAWINYSGAVSMDHREYELVTSEDMRQRGLPMLSSADLIRLQEEKNSVEEAQRNADELQNLTLRKFWQDIGAAIQGSMHDLLVVRHLPLSQVFCAPPRLRGFGFLLIALGLSGLLSCLVLGLRT